MNAMNDLMQLRKCRKPDCMRKVKVGTLYCCSPCGIAAAGQFEIHEHSSGCDERSAERGECNEFEAVMLPQTEAWKP